MASSGSGRGALLTAGGVSSIVAGAICALPSYIFGILAMPAVVFVCLSKREFGTGGEQNGI
jgi:hypothetical protein